jgi:hypothetical protein|tara:strand:+ start:917 stop:1615 length:699 start_codon:yes stop_codon:yes gene_type:complete
MTPSETEKIKLMQLFRQGKIDKLPNPDSDEYKMMKIKSMLDKEKTNEVVGAAAQRIDGLVDQQLLIKFLDTFQEIYFDLVEGGDEFFPEDIIDYLSQMMDNRAKDSRMDSPNINFEEAKENNSITISKDQMAKLHNTGVLKLGNNKLIYKMNENEVIKEEMGPTGIPISKEQIKDLIKIGSTTIKVFVQDKDGTNVREVDYAISNTNFRKNPDDIDTIDEGVEWFKKIAGTK